MHAQCFCFANLLYLLPFYPSRWRRRSRCLCFPLSVTFADFLTSFLLPCFHSTCGFWLTIILISKSFLSLICFRKLWLWNPGAYWSRNKVWPNHWYLWHGFLCGPWSSWIQRGKEKKSQGSCGISTQDYQGRIHEMVPAEGMSKALNNFYLFLSLWVWGVTVVYVNLIEVYSKQ